MSATPVTVVTGAEELLVSRAITRVVDEARGHHPDLDVTETSARELAVGTWAELVSPSLFDEARVVVIRDADQFTEELVGALRAHLGDPAPDIGVVLVHPGGTKPKALFEVLQAAGVPIVDCPAPRWPEDRERFVIEEITAAGGQIDPEAAGELVAAVGTDLRELASACAQLVVDSGGRVDADVVARYHRGRSEATGFVVADRAVEGDAPAAIEELRWALSTGVAPVLVTAALAANLRTIAAVAGEGRGSAQAVAGRLGMKPWKVRKAQSWARGWRPEGISTAIRAVALADADVKGAATDPGFALERAVLAVTTARGR